MESNAWTAMATSVPNLANKLRQVGLVLIIVSIISCEINNNKYANINELQSFDDNAFIDCDGMFLLLY